MSGTERLRTLVDSALLETATRSLEGYQQLSQRVRAALFAGERAASGPAGDDAASMIPGSVAGRGAAPPRPPPRTAQVYGLSVSTAYLQTITLELCTLLEARAALGLAEHAVLGSSSAHRPSDARRRSLTESLRRVAWVSKRDTGVARAGKILVALYPEAEGDRQCPDYLAALPYGVHPVAKARVLRDFSAALSHRVERDGVSRPLRNPSAAGEGHERGLVRRALERSALGLRSLFSEWVQQRHGRHPPQPQRPLKLSQLVHELEHTAVEWRVLVQLCQLPATFKSKVEGLYAKWASTANGHLPDYAVFDLGVHQAGGKPQLVHVSMLLRVLSLFESKSPRDLGMSTQTSVDYLERAVLACHDGYVGSVSFGVCAELIERATCHAAALLTNYLGLELWLPHSLAESLYVGRDPPAPLRTLKGHASMNRLLARGVEAALRLQMAVMPVNADGTSGRLLALRHGLAMLERSAVCLLMLLANRMRHQQQAAGGGGGRRGGKGGKGGSQDARADDDGGGGGGGGGVSLLSDAEAEALLLQPLRALSKQLVANRHSEVRARAREGGSFLPSLVLTPFLPPLLLTPFLPPSLAGARARAAPRLRRAARAVPPRAPPPSELPQGVPGEP